MQSSSQIFTTNKPMPNFLQAGCPSCHPTNSVGALKGNEAVLTVLLVIVLYKCNALHGIIRAHAVTHGYSSTNRVSVST